MEEKLAIIGELSRFGIFWFATILNISRSKHLLISSTMWRFVAIRCCAMQQLTTFEVLSTARDHVMRVTVIKDWQVHSCFASHKLFFVVS